MVDAIVLAGGLGTRLAQTIPLLPKALAPIRGIPFLHLLLTQIANSKIASTIVMALGHKASSIENFIEIQGPLSIPIQYSTEKFPLGTGGAVLYALPKTKSSTLLILNGDTFFDLPFEDFYNFHIQQKSSLTIACRYSSDCSRYGEILFDPSHRILQFTEKSRDAKGGWISGGIYLIQRELFDPFSSGTYSLENDFFPQFLKKGAFAYPHAGAFIDIGTPVSYEEAQNILQPWIPSI